VKNTWSHKQLLPPHCCYCFF